MGTDSKYKGVGGEGWGWGLFSYHKCINMRFLAGCHTFDSASADMFSLQYICSLFSSSLFFVFVFFLDLILSEASFFFFLMESYRGSLMVEFCHLANNSHAHTPRTIKRDISLISCQTPKMAEINHTHV